MQNGARCFGVPVERGFATLERGLHVRVPMDTERHKLDLRRQLLSCPVSIITLALMSFLHQISHLSVLQNFIIKPKPPISQHVSFFLIELAHIKNEK